MKYLTTKNLVIGGIVVIGAIVVMQQIKKQREKKESEAGTGTPAASIAAGFGTNTGGGFWEKIFG